LTSASAVDDLYITLKSEGITADVLVNNAGIMSPFIKIIDSDPLKWWQEMSIHVNGTYLMTRGFLKQLPASEKPRPTIINTSSIGGVEPSFVKPGSSAYSMGKVAVIKFTEFLTVEKPNIRSFVYHPGAVDTDLVRGAFPREELAGGFWSDTPELAGGYCLWMTTDRADFMINRWGSYDIVYDMTDISVNWDVEELEAKREEIVEKNLLKVLPTF
jgi:NAD(P)-dependent dehydrogenase (short-subunit alcohol dehydrogenase family)